MELDEILIKYIGEIGIYQILMIIFITSVGINIAFNSLDYTFTGAIPDIYCDVGNISHLVSNFSFQEIQKITSPLSDDGEIDTCLVYARNYSLLTVDDAREIIEGNEVSNITSECHKWVFDKEQFVSTIASEWNLVCDNEWLVATSQSVYMAGTFTVFIGGLLGDRFGRRKVALAALILHTMSRIGCACSVNYYMFLVFRFLTMVANVNWYTTVFVIAIEMVTPKYRVLAGQSAYYFWSVGYIMLAGMAYLIRDWRILTGVLLVFTVPFILHFCFLPESIRWLQSQGKTDEADVILRRMAKMNKRTLPGYVCLSEKENQTGKQGSILELFKSFHLMKNTLILVFDWFSVNLLYYGLIYYLPNLGGNIYISTMISGALEIPALIYVQFTLDTRLGRRINTSLLFLIGGIALLILMFIPKDYFWLILTLALIGRFSVAGVFSVVYFYTPEVFPTRYRAAGLTACSALSRFGGIIAPYITLSKKISIYFPTTVLGVLAIISGLISLLLPETRGAALPESFDDVLQGEKFKMSSEDLDGNGDGSSMKLNNNEENDKITEKV